MLRQAVNKFLSIAENRFNNTHHLNFRLYDYLLYHFTWGDFNLSYDDW